MADYLLVIRPDTPLPTADCPEGPAPARVERFGDPVERLEVQIAAFETPERFDDAVRGWLEIAERRGMVAFDPQLGRTVGRADLGEVLDCRARALAYALGVLGDAAVGVSPAEPARGVPGWVWALGAIVLGLVALRFCSSMAV
jgi:hypothetical protein